MNAPRDNKLNRDLVDKDQREGVDGERNETNKNYKQDIFSLHINKMYNSSFWL